MAAAEGVPADQIGHAAAAADLAVDPVGGRAVDPVAGEATEDRTGADPVIDTRIDDSGLRTAVPEESPGGRYGGFTPYPKSAIRDL